MDGDYHSGGGCVCVCVCVIGQQTESTSQTADLRNGVCRKLRPVEAVKRAMATITAGEGVCVLSFVHIGRSRRYLAYKSTCCLPDINKQNLLRRRILHCLP